PRGTAHAAIIVRRTTEEDNVDVRLIREAREAMPAVMVRPRATRMQLLRCETCHCGHLHRRSERRPCRKIWRGDAPNGHDNHVGEATGGRRLNELSRVSCGM